MLIKRVAPKTAVGGVYGLVYFAVDFGVGVGSFLLGFLVDKAWYTQLLWVMALWCVLGLPFAMLIYRSLNQLASW